MHLLEWRWKLTLEADCNVVWEPGAWNICLKKDNFVSLFTDQMRYQLT